MNQVTKYTGRYETAESLPKSIKQVRASSLVPKSQANIMNHIAGIFVRYNDRVFLVSRNQMIPEDSSLVLDSSQQICGIPVVAGGEISDQSRYVRQDALATCQKQCQVSCKVRNHETDHFTRSKA